MKKNQQAASWKNKKSRAQKIKDEQAALASTWGDGGGIQGTVQQQTTGNAKET